jgi:hypothetical protein
MRGKYAIRQEKLTSLAMRINEIWRFAGIAKLRAK